MTTIGRLHPRLCLRKDCVDPSVRVTPPTTSISCVRAEMFKTLNTGAHHSPKACFWFRLRRRVVWLAKRNLLAMFGLSAQLTTGVEEVNLCFRTLSVHSSISFRNFSERTRFRVSAVKT